MTRQWRKQPTKEPAIPGNSASILRLRYSGHEIDFGPPDDALQTCLRTIEVRAPGLLAHDARQIPTAKGSGKLIKEERKEGD
ncbi:hypothetical protein L914_00218 [Phytophthora nicotianae]|uniref:Uncharacterized protein n=1 Tax=Phytophthora nicotianae TaxID=4792 RepID=W2P896_PHYNI|nr:hypothetical protein L914_00218 [Phytophthora nicotianae]